MEIIIGLIGAAVGFFANKMMTAKMQKETEQGAASIVKAAKLEAEGIVKEAKLAAKDELLKMRDEFESSTKERRSEMQEVEKRLNERETNIERKMDLLQKRLDDVASRSEEISRLETDNRKRKAELDELIVRETSQLEGIASMTRDQARVQLMQKMESELANERGILIRRHHDEVKQKCQRTAQKLMVEAMQRYAGECAYDRTTATVPLPSDEMKGRIIGREGRNIRVFEAATGVNVLIDDTPAAVVIACFDPVRREVARLALEQLVSDGRIHPTRVEEVVAKAQQDVEDDVEKAGEEALQNLQIVGTAPQVAKMLGRLRYRYSFTQNVLQHSMEVASFMAMIAGELGMDVEKARRMGLFHDIGKAMDHEVEGPHAIIGMEFLKRCGEDPEVLNGVGCHHNEIPAESPLASLVSVCDALSASRPGARCETTDFYIKRLEDLEEIGNGFDGVDSCYAVQAGREIRVIVQPDRVTENQALTLSRDIASKIESDMQYPGQIKVCVIRETRSVEYAK
jgi:ribonuclease Y